MGGEVAFLNNKSYPSRHRDDTVSPWFLSRHHTEEEEEEEAKDWSELG